MANTFFKEWSSLRYGLWKLPNSCMNTDKTSTLTPDDDDSCSDSDDETTNDNDLLQTLLWQRWLGAWRDYWALWSVFSLTLCTLREVCCSFIDARALSLTETEISTIRRQWTQNTYGMNYYRRPDFFIRRTWLQQVEEDMGQPISACQFANVDHLLWRSPRPSAGQAEQWVSTSNEICN